MSIAKQIEDKERAAMVLEELGVVCTGQGDLAEARGYWEEALNLALHLRNKRALASALNALAQLDRMECRSEQLYERVLAIARELEDQEPIAIGLLNLAMVPIGRGSHDRALETLAEALAIAEAMGSKRAGQSGLEVSAGLLASREESERAAILFGAAEAQMAHTGLRGDRADEAFLAPLIAKTHDALGEPAFAAAKAAGRALPYEVALAQARASLREYR